LYEERNEELRNKYIKEVLNVIPEENLVFMDETGVDHQIKQDKVWVKKGNRIFDNKKGSERGRTSIIAGYKRNNSINSNINKVNNIDSNRDDNSNKTNNNINLNSKLIAPFYFNGNTTSEVFITWLKDVLLPVWNNKDTLIMDNASWHKTQIVKDFLKLNNINYIYQPPYSPDLNPIEYCWANLKRKLKTIKDEINFYNKLEKVLV